jgi:hypothetical protein
MANMAETTQTAIGGLRGRTVSPCDCSHVAPGNAAGREDRPTSSRSVAGQSSGASGVVIEGEEILGSEL